MKSAGKAVFFDYKNRQKLTFSVNYFRVFYRKVD